MTNANNVQKVYPKSGVIKLIASNNNIIYVNFYLPVVNLNTGLGNPLPRIYFFLGDYFIKKEKIIAIKAAPSTSAAMMIMAPLISPLASG